MKKLCVSLMALVALLCVSCSNDPEIPEKNDNGIDVTLSITTNPLTKALDDNQVTKTAPIDPSKEFIVYFMDGSTPSPKVVASYQLTDDQITAIQTAGTGVKFTNLDPSVKGVYVVANVPKEGVTMPTTPATTTLTTINATVMNIKDQQEANAASVVLANTGKTVKTSFTSVAAASNGNAQFTVAVELTPIVSRIQIKKVSADNTITDFTLAGIYIDNFYQNMSIGGTLTNQKKADKTDCFVSTYTNYSNSGLFDEATDMVKVPFNPDNKNDTELGENDKKVYGYQFFPTSTGLTTVPYIILKLTNVGGTTRTFPNAAYYVAVKAYK